MSRVEDLTAARDYEIPSNMISKALKSLERLNEAFKKAVSVGLSLTGTGSDRLAKFPCATLESQDVAAEYF